MSRGQKENYSAQLKKGVLEMLVLFLLSQQDLYGYQLCQKLVTGSKGLFPITENSLYPVLYRLVETIMFPLEGRKCGTSSCLLPLGRFRKGTSGISSRRVPHPPYGSREHFSLPGNRMFCGHNTAPLQEEFPVESFFFRIDETDFPS